MFGVREVVSFLAIVFVWVCARAALVVSELVGSTYTFTYGGSGGYNTSYGGSYGAGGGGGYGGYGGYRKGTYGVGYA